MNDTQEYSTTQTTEVQQLGTATGKAFIAWLKVLVYFIILPFKIWKAATFRLAQNNDDAIVSNDEEFPMYTFTKVSLDSSIFMLGILAVPSAFFGVGFGIYFIVIPILSFSKEVMTMSLSTVHKLDKIAKNTTKEI